VSVVEGCCCFCVVECFLEGFGEFEFVVEFVDGDEGSESFASFFGGGLKFFRGEAPFDIWWLIPIYIKTGPYLWFPVAKLDPTPPP
jgi:hypothetical protein